MQKERASFCLDCYLYKPESQQCILIQSPYSPVSPICAAAQRGFFLQSVFNHSAQKNWSECPFFKKWGMVTELRGAFETGYAEVMLQDRRWLGDLMRVVFLQVTGVSTGSPGCVRTGQRCALQHTSPSQALTAQVRGLQSALASFQPRHRVFFHAETEEVVGWGVSQGAPLDPELREPFWVSQPGRGQPPAHRMWSWMPPGWADVGGELQCFPLLLQGCSVQSIILYSFSTVLMHMLMERPPIPWRDGNAF